MPSNALAISMFALVLGSLGVTHATAISIAPSAPQSIYQAAADLEMTVAAQVASLRDRPRRTLHAADSGAGAGPLRDFQLAGRELDSACGGNADQPEYFRASRRSSGLGLP